MCSPVREGDTDWGDSGPGAGRSAVPHYEGVFVTYRP